MQTPPRKNYIVLMAAIIALTAFIERQMGRLYFCKCGVISLWSGDIWSNQNSQQFADPYSFTHVLHGVIFYFLLWLVLGKRASPWLRLVLAVSLESGWELLENSPLIIDRYRAATISLDYYGDSILNSISDVLMMATGFVIAWKLPWKASLAFFILTEIFLLFWIRDNLTLNIVMLIHPLQMIKDWQMKL